MEWNGMEWNGMEEQNGCLGVGGVWQLESGMEWKSRMGALGGGGGGMATGIWNGMEEQTGCLGGGGGMATGIWNEILNPWQSLCNGADELTDTHVQFIRLAAP